MRKALVIGIDHYKGLSPLKCAVNDATEIAKLLKRNGNRDESPNFGVELLTSDSSDLTNRGLVKGISRFFKSTVSAEVAVLYFAGHGIINPQTDAGYLVGTDGSQGAWGMSLWELLGLANEAHRSIATSVIILDCCHAGHMGTTTPGLEASTTSAIGKGVTILSSCNNDEQAIETGRHGVFTELLLDGLRGGCADINGNITPAALYSHIDQAMKEFEQRPLYKANVQRFVTLRQVTPKIPPEVLRQLADIFKDPDEKLQLDPSFEPTRDVPEEMKRTPVNPENAAVFSVLQKCVAQGLVEPVDEKHMFWAAVHSKKCRLTPLGKHYHRLVLNNKI
jgi:uncharacterized caspase-like protein